MKMFPSTLPFLLLTILFIFVQQTTPQPTPTHIKQQYTRDIQNLSQRISSFSLISNPSIPILPAPNSTQTPYKKIEFQPENVWLGENQFAEFSYPNLGDGSIDIRVMEVMLKEKDVEIYKTAKEHYQQKKESFRGLNQSDSEGKACRLKDPQIQLQKLRLYRFSSYYESPLLTFQSKVLLYLNPLGEYRVLRFNGRSLEILRLDIDISNEIFSKSQVSVFPSRQLQAINKLKEVFLFEYEREKMMVYNDGNLWSVGVEEVTKVDYLFHVQKYGIVSLDDSDGEIDSTWKQEKEISIIQLKCGFLVQYETYFQIYMESQSNPQPQKFNSSDTASIKTFLPKFSVNQIRKLTNSKKIVSISVSQQLSHQSGYKIYVLLQSSTLIELQYGSYSSINLFNIQYGQNFHHLQVKDDIVQITFSITKSKMAYFYVMELFIDRKQNPKSPKIYLNRFYNDLKNLKKTLFLNQREVMLIGETDVLIYDWPVDSQILIKQNISQSPYHFTASKLDQVFVLDRYSTNQTDCVILVTEKQLMIAKLTRKPQTIECSSDKSFDSRIEILKYCDSNRQELCKYIGSLRILIQNADSQRIKSLKTYLIIGLIIAIVISICIVVRQICHNKKTIQKLQKIKEKINKKYNEMESKGKKVHQDDKFQEFQQEITQENDEKNNKKSEILQKPEQK